MCTVPHTAMLAHSCVDQHAPVSLLSCYSAVNMEHADMIVKHLIKKEVRKSESSFYASFNSEAREASHAKHSDSILPISNPS